MSNLPPPNLTEDRALYHDVQSYIVGLIRAGEVKPGERINEAEIARRLAISRTPVREAFARLIKDGILIHSPRRGVFVSQYARGEAAEIASLRVVIEGFAARLAAQRIQPEDAEHLRTILKEGIAAGERGDWLAIEEKNAEFHDAIVNIARHGLLLRVWGMLTPSLWKLTPMGRPGSFDSAALQSFIERHQALLDAILSGDPQRAEQAAMLHVQKAFTHVRHNLVLPEEGDTPEVS